MTCGRLNRRVESIPIGLWVRLLIWISLQMTTRIITIGYGDYQIQKWLATQQPLLYVQSPDSWWLTISIFSVSDCILGLPF